MGLNAQSGRRSCRFSSEGPSFGRTFAVASAVKASVSIGSRSLLPSALPCDPSSSASCEIIICGNRGEKTPPLHIHLISTGCRAGRVAGSHGKLFLQALQPPSDISKVVMISSRREIAVLARCFRHAAGSSMSLGANGRSRVCMPRSQLSPGSAVPLRA